MKMKLFWFFVLITLCSTFTAKKNDGCNTRDPRCRNRVSSGSSTCAEHLLPWLCLIGHVCCDKEDPAKIHYPVVGKRACLSTPKKCQRMGGSCVSANNSSGTCQTTAISELCNSSSCTCCIGDNPACGMLPRCRLRGGFCYKGKKRKMCQSRNSLKSGCSGRKCSCCIVDRGCTCGEALTSKRIVGGQKVRPRHKYPWIVGIQAPSFLNETYICGGSIINEYYIVTAAHCMFDPFTGERGPEDILVGIADHNQYSTNDDIPGVTGLVDVKHIIIHKKYVSHKPAYDIALLKLKNPLDLSTYPELRAVCLPINDKETYEGTTGFIYGWGTTETSSKPQGILRETTVPILNPECDNKIIGGARITPSMLCAGYPEGGRDTCSGDSGGPLTVEEKGAHILVGVTSFGEGCGGKNSPGVYTRVTSYLSWIMNNTKDSTFCN